MRALISSFMANLVHSGEEKQPNTERDREGERRREKEWENGRKKERGERKAPGFHLRGHHCRGRDVLDLETEQFFTGNKLCQNLIHGQRRPFYRVFQSNGCSKTEAHGGSPKCHGEIRHLVRPNSF